MPDDEKKDAKKSLYWISVNFVIEIIFVIIIAWYATSGADSTLVTPIYIISGIVIFFLTVAASSLSAGALKENDLFLVVGLGAFVVADLLDIALIVMITVLFIEQGFLSTTICIIIAVLFVLLCIVGLWVYWKRINSSRNVLKGQ